jgi:hypothetical protein
MTRVAIDVVLQRAVESPAHGVRSTETVTFPPPLNGLGTRRNTSRDGQSHRPPIFRPWIGVLPTLRVDSE